MFSCLKFHEFKPEASRYNVGIIHSIKFIFDKFNFKRIDFSQPVDAERLQLMTGIFNDESEGEDGDFYVNIFTNNSNVGLKVNIEIWYNDELPECKAKAEELLFELKLGV